MVIPPKITYAPFYEALQKWCGRNSRRTNCKNFENREEFDHFCCIYTLHKCTSGFKRRYLIFPDDEI